MNNYNLITLTRYLSLFMVIMNSLNEINILPTYLFFLILIFIINNQIRYFNSYNRKSLMTASLITESFLVFLISNYVDKVNVFFFIPMILDITNSKKIYNKTTYLMLIIIFSLTINIRYSISDAFEYSFILLIISILCIYIHKENLSKSKTEKIYDQLRISEDKLKKSNSDLEIYIDSLEELTILKERNRISREIHDSVGHALSTTIIQLGAIENLVSFDKDLKELVFELREFVKKSLIEVRNAINTLKPDEYENYENLFKIKELVNNFSKMTNIDVKITISKYTWKLSSIQSISLYRVIQEALSNCVKHSNATRIQIFFEGEVFGLIGPNGAGKSTLINIISGLMSPNNGTVEIDNMNIKKDSIKIKSTLGLVPQELAIIETLTPYDNLEYFGSLCGLHGKLLKERINECLEISGLSDVKKKKVNKLSGGMKRRLNIAIALINHPKILILDEPTVGVDPQSRNYIFTVLKKLSKEENTTIIYTSHYMEEVENLCSKIFIMDEGKEIACGNQEYLKGLVSSNTNISICINNLNGNILFELKNLEGVISVKEEDNSLLLTTEKNFSISKALSILENNNASLSSISYDNSSLEDVFLNLTGKNLRD